MISIECLIFSLINVLIFLLNHGGSLSLHKIVSCGIKLLIMFNTVLCQLHSLIALVISSVLAFYVVPKFSYMRWREKICMLNLTYTISWWQLGCRDGCTPDSVIKLGWEVNIRSIQEEVLFKIWRPYCFIILNVFFRLHNFIEYQISMRMRDWPEGMF